MTEVTSTRTKQDTDTGCLLDTKFLESITTAVLWKDSMRPNLCQDSCLRLFRGHPESPTACLLNLTWDAMATSLRTNRTHSATFVPHCSQQRARKFNSTAADPVTIRREIKETKGMLA